MGFAEGAYSQFVWLDLRPFAFISHHGQAAAAAVEFFIIDRSLYQEDAQARALKSQWW